MDDDWFQRTARLARARTCNSAPDGLCLTGSNGGEYIHPQLLLRRRATGALPGLKGLMLQSQYRSQAMKGLGLERIPSRPEREFKAIDQTLANVKTKDEKVNAIGKLRTKAESQWIAKEYTAARATSSGGTQVTWNALNIFQMLRCCDLCAGRHYFLRWERIC